MKCEGEEPMGVIKSKLGQRWRSMGVSRRGQSTATGWRIMANGQGDRPKGDCKGVAGHGTGPTTSET